LISIRMLLEPVGLAHPYPTEWCKIGVYWGFWGLDGGK